MKAKPENYPEVLTEKEARRFWDKVNKDGPLSDLVEGKCRIWTASQNKKGYGQFVLRGRNVTSHRLSYTLSLGTISGDLEVDHLCKNRACLNPKHLESVTSLENTRRGDANLEQLSKTHCPFGHKLDKVNLVTSILKLGRRGCKACARARSKYQRAKSKNSPLDPNLFQKVADEYYKEITQGV